MAEIEEKTVTSGRDQGREGGMLFYTSSPIKLCPPSLKFTVSLLKGGSLSLVHYAGVGFTC